MDELRQAFRSLRRAPGTTLAAVVTLAIGIGPTVAMFTVVHSALVRPLPYSEPHRIVAPLIVDPIAGEQAPLLTGPVLDAVERMTAFDRTARMHVFLGLLLGAAEPFLAFGAEVQPAFFETFGLRPALGRVPAAEGEAILSHRLWTQRFGGAAGIVGSPATHADRPITIVGVASPSFDFPYAAGIWVARADGGAGERAGEYIDVAARLAPGQTLSGARQELAVVAAGLGADARTELGSRRLELQSLQEAETGFLRRPLLTLLGAAALVVLIACANVANLLLAAGTARRREIAVRSAIGASRWRVARGLLAESCVLSAVGIAAGVLLAGWTLPGLFTLMPAPISRVAAPDISPAVLGFAAALSTLVTMVSGWLPAWRIASVPAIETLSATSGTLTPRPSRLVRGLVAIEVAVGTVLVVGTALMLASLDRLATGLALLDVADVASIQIDLPLGSPDKFDAAARVVGAVQDQVLNGAADLVATSALPFAPVEPRDVTAGDTAEVLRVATRSITPGYFERLGLSLRAGRGFEADDRRGYPLVAVVNETMARRLEQGTGTPALGSEFRMSVDPERGHPAAPAMSADRLPMAPVRVVGIVADLRHTMTGRPTAEIFVPLTQVVAPQRLYVLGSQAASALVAARVRRAVRETSADVPVGDPTGLWQLLDRSIQLHRFRSMLFSSFGVVALLLAASGIFAVVACAVARRTREVALRLALGSTRAAVVRTIAVPIAVPVALGLVAGLAIARALTSVVRGMLFYEVSPTSPSVYALATLVLVAATVLACWLPIRRACALSPADALRQE